MSRPIYFDYAATNPCCEEAIQAMAPFAAQTFGHPSSTHAYGQKAAAAIREARRFFAEIFQVEPEQVIFTGSGTEADNLAISGIALGSLKHGLPIAGSILYSAIEHSAVTKTAKALADFGLLPEAIPVTRSGQIDESAYGALLIKKPKLVSVHLVNNIIGAVFPVEALARGVKSASPGTVFHTDAIQGFGRVETPRSGSSVDLVSISSHKVEGPKGIGALIVLNKPLLKTLRPIVYGGGQEGGLRSGTQNAGLIAGFHAAARLTFSKRARYTEYTAQLRATLRAELASRGLISAQDQEPSSKQHRIHWNSPAEAVPHIMNISFPGLQAGPISRLLEERGCLVSTGSACSAGKPDPDPVLAALGLPLSHQISAIRISVSDKTAPDDIKFLAAAIEESIQRSDLLAGTGPRRGRR